MADTHKLPSRRELRLQRQAAERENAQPSPAASAVPRRTHMGAEERAARLAALRERSAQSAPRAQRRVSAHMSIQEQPTQPVAPIAAPVSPHSVPVSSHLSPVSSHPSSVRKGSHIRQPVARHTGGSRSLVAMVSTFSLAAATIAGAGFMISRPNAASAAGTGVESTLLGLGADFGQTPQSLHKTDGAKDSARYAQASRGTGNAVCVDTSGANSLAAAFAPTDTMVVKPIKAGSYTVTSPFGERTDPFDGGESFHLGVDLGAPAGTPVYAVADGTVIHAGDSIEGRSPSMIVIEHTINGEKYTSWYVHMWEDGVHVKEGDAVKAGQYIADVGSNGASTGPHLHFEFHPGAGVKTEPVDPLPALEELGALDIDSMCS